MAEAVPQANPDKPLVLEVGRWYRLRGGERALCFEKTELLIWDRGTVPGFVLHRNGDRRDTVDVYFDGRSTWGDFDSDIVADCGPPTGKEIRRFQQASAPAIARLGI